MAKAQLQMWAEMLAAADDFVTFVDILGLCRLADSHAHLPVATIESLLELRAAQPLTLGARALLGRTLTGYAQRVRAQRRRARSHPGIADANQLMRLTRGQSIELSLSLRGGPWVPDVDSAGPIASVRPAGVHGALQKLTLTAEAAGSGELVLRRQPDDAGRMGGKTTQATRRPAHALPHTLVFVVVVETAQEAALFAEPDDAVR